MKSLLANLTIKIIISIILITGMLLFTPNAWARAKTIYLEGDGEFSEPVDPGEEWVSGNYFHIRGLEMIAVMYGELTGVFTIRININYNIETVDGNGNGYATMDLSFGSLEGYFEGRFSYEQSIESWEIIGIFHGSGDFEGMKLFAIFTGDTLPHVAFSYEVTLLDSRGTITNGE